MWNGSYNQWNPIAELSGKRLYTEAVHDDLELFRIWLRPDEVTLPMLIVKFESPLMYVNSDEGYRIAQIEPPQKLNFPHTFWTVENSELLKIFHRQSAEWLNDLKIVHYAFLSCNDCVDVLSSVEPVFVWDKG